MKVGIVGMPNAGKSSLFNALTRAGAEAANYPFTTIEPNIAIVPVEDERLDEVSAVIGASDVVADTISFHDIAGLVRARARARGSATSSSGTSARPTRSSTSSAPTTTRTSCTPRAPSTRRATSRRSRPSCVYADLEQVEKRLDRVVRTARGGDRPAVAEQGWLEAVRAELQAGRPARGIPMPEAIEASQSVHLSPPSPCSSWPTSTRAPTRSPPAVADHAAAVGAGVVAVSSRIESELREMDDADAAEMRAELGVGESGLQRVVRGAFALLDQIAFFTVGTGKRAQSWHLRRGLTAWHAAGEIHSDIQRGFVRAEVIPYDKLIAAGGYAAARDVGTLRLEGRDYVMQDGDVITVKFTP